MYPIRRSTDAPFNKSYGKIELFLLFLLLIVVIVVEIKESKELRM